MKKSDYIVRVLSVAPLLAAIMLTVLFFTRPELFKAWYTYALMTATLGALPLLAYPMQRFIPRFKDGGRKAQRTLAMIFAVAGYVLCALILLITKGTDAEWLICLTYLISGILIFVINKVFKIHASGHGCGIIGPISILLIFHSYITAALYAISAIFVCISSVRSKRHKLSEFIGGASVSTVTALVLALFFI